MSKTTLLSLPILALAIAGGAAFAQAPEAPKSPELAKFYKLEFVVKEVEGGKVLNARSYSTLAAADARDGASIRTGSRIPIFAPGPPNQPNSVAQYIDVGVNIDCRNIKDSQHDLSLFVAAEVSSQGSEPAAPAPVGAQLPPTIRQNKWNSLVVVPLSKPTVIFSSDDLTSKRQFQLELTATPIH
ncbi:MAG: hypothetical protein ACLQGV_03555 [Bryobacteraceae bacterium]